MNRISKCIIAIFCMALLIVPIGAMTTEPDLRDSSAQCTTETLELMKSDAQESGCQLAINQAKLLITYSRLYEANDQLLEHGVPLGGVHINVETNTLYVSLTDVEEEYTSVIAGIVPDDVNLQFLEVEHTLAELEDAKDKLNEKMTSGCINITLLGIDIKDNELMVGFAEITYSEIEAVRLIVGNVSIEFIEEELVLDAGKHDRYRPVFGGIQVATRPGR